MARAGTGRARTGTPPPDGGADPFATAALRSAVLDAWAASPTRFREDANAEEDLRLGGYADTWFVEFVQNAADAAGDAGRVRMTLELMIGGDPRVLAELLDLPLAAEIVAGDGEPVDWAELREIVVACHSLGVDVPEGGLRRHAQLWVRLRRPTTGRHRVPVWRDGAGAWHAEDPVRALLALLAR